MDADYEVFYVRIATQSRVPLLAGGICQNDAKKEAIKGFLSLSRLTFGAWDNAYRIDRRLAEALEACSSPGVLAAGACVRIGEDMPRTGGVIGAPHRGIASADGSLEEIAPGFYLSAKPGGPGFIIRCGDETATKIWKQCGPLMSPEEHMACFAEFSVQTYLLVTDGSGREAGGMLAAASATKMICEYL